MIDIRAIINRWTVVAVFITSCCTGCNGVKVLMPDDYLKWMNDPSNGMVKQKEINGLMYEVKYLTPEVMALNELRKTNVGKEEFQNIRKQYGNMNYFRLRIYDKGGGHIYNYLRKKRVDPDEVEAYYNYSAQKDWIVISGSIDTAKCTLFTFAKTYGASVEFDFEMGYINRDSLRKGDMSLEYDDRVLNNGTLKFLFSSKDLQKIPQIKI